MTQNYDELLSALSNDDRYSQGACSKCAKGFENHEYHCFGPETEGCIVSQKELHATVRQWKKERKQAAVAIRELQAEWDEKEEGINYLARKRDELSDLVQVLLADLATSRASNASEFKRGQEVMREAAAKHVSPAFKPPCDCIEQLENGSWIQSCSCHNEGDVANVSYWCTAKNMAYEIRNLPIGAGLKP